MQRNKRKDRNSQQYYSVNPAILKAMKNEAKQPVLKSQIGFFLLFGCTAVVVDFLCYHFFLLFLSHSPAKALSFFAGSIVSYTGNKYFTFTSDKLAKHALPQFYTLYLISLTANVLVNKVVLSIFPTYILFAFLCATGVSTIISFIGQKWWVFKSAP
jgi:putative flippase GtrA